MSPEILSAWAAVSVALLGVLLTGCAVWFARGAVLESQHQTRLQREVAEQSAQPYVWADVRGSDHTGFLIELVVGNSGPTVATDVQISFDPPLPVSRQNGERDASTDTALTRLEEGLSSLAPGRVLRWTLGTGPDILSSVQSQQYRVSVNGSGPFGPLPALSYVLNLSDWRESADRPDGSLHLLTKAVKDGLGKLAP